MKLSESIHVFFRGNSTYVLFDESSIHVGKVILFQIRSLDDPGKDVDGHREDDGAVVLRRDAAQGLQVAQLGSIHKIQILNLLAISKI